MWRIKVTCFTTLNEKLVKEGVFNDEQTEGVILYSISTVFSTHVKNSGSLFCKVQIRA